MAGHDRVAAPEEVADARGPRIGSPGRPERGGGVELAAVLERVAGEHDVATAGAHDSGDRTGGVAGRVHEVDRVGQGEAVGRHDAQAPVRRHARRQLRRVAGIGGAGRGGVLQLRRVHHDRRVGEQLDVAGVVEVQVAHDDDVDVGRGQARPCELGEQTGAVADAAGVEQDAVSTRAHEGHRRDPRETAGGGDGSPRQQHLDARRGHGVGSTRRHLSSQSGRSPKKASSRAWRHAQSASGSSAATAPAMASSTRSCSPDE